MALASVNGWKNSEVFGGLTTFYKVDFTISHAIPTGGVIEVVFTGADPKDNQWTGGADETACLVAPHSSLTCSITAGSTTAALLVGSTTLAAGPVSVVVMLQFSASATGLTAAAVTSITTKTAAGLIIDQSSSTGLAFSIGPDAKALESFAVNAYKTATGTATINDFGVEDGVTGAATDFIAFVFDTQPGQTMTSTGKIEVNCPMLVTSSQGFKTLTITVDAEWEQKTENSLVTVAPDLTSVTDDDSKASAVTGKVTSTVVAGMSDGGFLALMVKETVPSSNSLKIEVIAPLILPNLSTFYECQGKLIENDSEATTYYGYDVMLLAQLSNKDNEAYHMCLHNTAESIPIVATVKAVEIDLPHSKNYEILIEKTGGFGFAGTTTVETDIPLFSDMPGATASWISNTQVKLSGFTSNLIEAAVNLKQAWIPNLGRTTAVTSTLQYPDTDYGQDNVIYKSSSTDSDANPGGAWAIFTSSNAPQTPSTSTVYDMTLKPADDGNIKGVFGLSVPTGYDISSAAINVIVDEVKLYSKTPGFNANIIIGEENIPADLVNDADTVVQLLEVKNLVAEGTVSLTAFLAPPKSEGIPAGGAVCISIGAPTIAGATLPQTTLAVSVKEPLCNEKGPTGYDLTMELTITVVYPIPATTGRIVIVLENQFSTADSLTECSSPAGACEVTLQTATVTAGSLGVAAGTVIVTITGLEGPAAASPSPVDIVTSVITFDGSSKIDETAEPKGTCSTVSSKAEASSATIGTVRAYPNSAGILTDLYTELSFKVDLPRGATFEFEAVPSVGVFTVLGNPEDHFWSNAEFSSVVIAASKVTVTLAEDVRSSETIKLYIDDLFTLSVTAGTVTDAFSAVSKWNNNEISKTAAGSSFTVGEAVSANPLSEGSVLHDPTTAGLPSSYAITFKSTTELSGTKHDLWVVFPQDDFDPLVVCRTDTRKPGDCNKDSEFVDCDSAELQGVSCVADHWVVVVSGFDLIPASTGVTINIHGVCNPDASVTGSIKVFAVSTSANTSGPGIAGSVTIGTVTPTAVPGALALQRVEIDSNDLSAAGSYTTSFFLSTDTTLAVTTEIWVDFPKQFNFDRGDTVSCSSNYFDEAPDLTAEVKAAPIPIVEGGSCAVYYNTVKQSLIESLPATTDFRIQFVMGSVFNPDSGLKRTDVYYDNGLLAETVFGVNYKYWSSKFNVMIYDATNKNVEFMSVDNLHSGYLGYKSKNEEIVNVNGPIKVCRGTCTAFKVTVDTAIPLTSLTFIPVLESGTVISPFHNFIMNQWETSIDLWACIESSVNEGFYSISWSTAEEPATSNLFTPPPNTEIEVCECSDKVIVVATPPANLYYGKTSMPIKVQLSNPPASDVTVTVASDNSEVTVLAGESDGALPFTSSTTELYFQLQVASTASGNLTDNVEITFELSGTDTGSYTAIPKWTINKNSFKEFATANDVAPTVELSASTTAKDTNSASLTVTGKESGVIYWWVHCGSRTHSPSATKLSVVNNFLARTGMSPLTEQLRTEYTNNEVAVNTAKDTDMIDFFYRLFHEHCGTLYLEAEPCYADIAISIDIDWLWEDTKYIVGAKMSNLLSTNDSDVSSLSFETTSLGNAVSYAVKADISSAISPVQADNIERIIADSFGFPEKWLLDQEIVFSNDNAGRRLSIVDSTVSWTIVSDPRFATSPSGLVASDGSGFIQAVAGELGISDSALSVSSTELSQGSFILISAVVGDLAVVLENGDSLTIQVTVNGEGLGCAVCVVEDGDSVTPSSDDTVAGIDEDGNNVSEGCVKFNSTAAFDIKVAGLEKSTEYNCYVVLCSSYPLFPDCQTTPASVTGSTTFASYMSVFLLLVFGLIFS